MKVDYYHKLTQYEKHWLRAFNRRFRQPSQPQFVPLTEIPYINKEIECLILEDFLKKTQDVLLLKR